MRKTEVRLCIAPKICTRTSLNEYFIERMNANTTLNHRRYLRNHHLPKITVNHREQGEEKNPRIQPQDRQ